MCIARLISEGIGWITHVDVLAPQHRHVADATRQHVDIAGEVRSYLTHRVPIVSDNRNRGAVNENLTVAINATIQAIAERARFIVREVDFVILRTGLNRPESERIQQGVAQISWHGQNHVASADAAKIGPRSARANSTHDVDDVINQIMHAIRANCANGCIVPIDHGRVHCRTSVTETVISVAGIDQRFQSGELAGVARVTIDDHALQVLFERDTGQGQRPQQLIVDLFALLGEYRPLIANTPIVLGKITHRTRAGNAALIRQQHFAGAEFNTRRIGTSRNRAVSLATD